jgi:hypothetical protein
MYSNRYHIYFLILLSQSFNAQVGILCDSLTNEPLPFVTILQNGRGFYSDEAGRFTIHDTSKPLHFYALGYKELDNYTLKGSNDTIRLQPEVINLDEVIVEGRRGKKPELIGLSKQKKALSFACVPGLEIAVFIANPLKKDMPIHSVDLPVRVRTASQVAVRLHLYTKDIETGEPGGELTLQNIIMPIARKSDGDIVINVADYGFELPEEGIFAGIEWLGYYDAATGISGMDDGFATEVEMHESHSALTYTRNRLGTYPWTNISEKLVPGGKFNASIGIKVYP